MSQSNETKRRNALRRAIQVAGGTHRDLGELVDPPVSPQAVQQWVEANAVPAYRVLQIEKATGVSRHRLAPELYPRDTPETRGKRTSARKEAAA